VLDEQLANTGCFDKFVERLDSGYTLVVAIKGDPKGGAVTEIRDAIRRALDRKLGWQEPPVGN